MTVNSSFAEIGIQNRALIDEQFTLDLDRVGRAVAVARVRCVVAQEVDCLLAFEVDQPEHIALGDAMAPGPPGWHHLVEHDFAGRQALVDHGILVTDCD